MLLGAILKPLLFQFFCFREYSVLAHYVLVVLRVKFHNQRKIIKIKRGVLQAIKE